MKLTQETVEILQNFSTISNAIVINPGSELRVRDIDNTMFAIANIKDSFTNTIRIFNMPQLLAAISMFDNPDLETHSDFLYVKSGRSKLRYVYTPERLMNVDIPTKSPQLTEVYKFDFTEKHISEINKAIGILGVEDIVIESNAATKEVVITVTKRDETSSPEHTMVVAEGITVPDSKIYLNPNRLKLIRSDYVLTVCKNKNDKLVLRFKSQKYDVSYWVSVEKGSEVK